MKVTLRDVLRACRVALKKFLNKRDKWVKEWAGQVSWARPMGGREGRSHGEAADVDRTPFWAQAWLPGLRAPSSCP